MLGVAGGRSIRRTACRTGMILVFACKTRGEARREHVIVGKRGETRQQRVRSMRKAPRLFAIGGADSGEGEKILRIRGDAIIVERAGSIARKREILARLDSRRREERSKPAARRSASLAARTA
jgi:hypothetical protein